MLPSDNSPSSLGLRGFSHERKMSENIARSKDYVKCKRGFIRGKKFYFHNNNSTIASNIARSKDNVNWILLAKKKKKMNFLHNFSI